MKLIVAIIQDELNEPILQSLIQEDFRATRISSTGGFLRRGLTTLMIGVEDEKVDQAIQIIKDQSSTVSNSNQRSATVFVLDVDQFIQV
jgi:uncharacterized protein YaaQ